MTLGPIGAVRIFVSDFAAARHFYSQALGLAESWSDGESAATFAPGSCQLVVETADPDGPEGAALIGRFTGLSFVVEDIAAAVRDFESRGVVFDGPPATQSWAVFSPISRTLTATS